MARRALIERIIIVVLDGAGIGALPDAAEYGDEDSNTIVNTARAVGGLVLPNLQVLGLGNLDDIPGVPPEPNCAGSYGTMLEKSKGKDTTTGHWEIAGVITEEPFPTYPHGFPPEVIEKFERAIGRGVLGNCVASGTEIIERLGAEHMRTGKPIVYTSADSVFQIAAHEEVIPVEQLYAISAKARRILTGKHRVARVIARPFVGEPGSFRRTENRRDFSVEPPRPTILDRISKSGLPVVGIGKIGDIFAERGLTESLHATNNEIGMELTIEVARQANSGLVFTNLVDFDMLWGHRNDPRGFSDALWRFDSRLPDLQEAMHPTDMLIITADHGNDPTTTSTDHSRERVPLLVWGETLNKAVNLGERKTFADIAATVADVFGLRGCWPGTSFANEILGR